MSENIRCKLRYEEVSDYLAWLDVYFPGFKVVSSKSLNPGESVCVRSLETGFTRIELHLLRSEDDLDAQNTYYLEEHLMRNPNTPSHRVFRVQTCGKGVYQDEGNPCVALCMPVVIIEQVKELEGDQT